MVLHHLVGCAKAADDCAEAAIKTLRCPSISSGNIELADARRLRRGARRSVLPTVRLRRSTSERDSEQVNVQRAVGIRGR